MLKPGRTRFVEAKLEISFKGTNFLQEKFPFFFPVSAGRPGRSLRKPAKGNPGSGFPVLPADGMRLFSRGGASRNPRVNSP